MNLVPAYGRDYNSKAEIVRDLEADLDFLIADISSPWNGSYVNLSQLITAKRTTINVRYKNQRSVAVFQVSKLKVKK